MTTNTYSERHATIQQQTLTERQPRLGNDKRRRPINKQQTSSDTQLAQQTTAHNKQTKHEHQAICLPRGGYIALIENLYKIFTRIPPASAWRVTGEPSGLTSDTAL